MIHLDEWEKETYLPIAIKFFHDEKYDAEDEWYIIGPRLDLNIWRDYDTDEVVGTLYRVINGETKTQEWLEIAREPAYG